MPRETGKNSPITLKETQKVSLLIYAYSYTGGAVVAVSARACAAAECGLLWAALPRVPHPIRQPEDSDYHGR